MHVDEAAGLVTAAGEGDLELAAEVLAVGVTEQESGQGLGVGRDVEGLGAADARQRACGHISDRVAAGLSCGDVDGCEPAHEVDGILDMNVMQLHILARGDVADRIRVLFPQIGEDVQLTGGQASEGDLDALHPGRMPHRVRPLRALLGEYQLLGAGAVEPLPIVVALSVRPAAQTSLREDDFVQLVLFAQVNLGLENVDLTAQLFRDGLAEFFLPGNISHISHHQRPQLNS